MDVVENLESAIAAVEEARSVPLSASCVINRSELLQLLDKIKVSFPNDLAKAISIQRDKEDILEEAHEQADALQLYQNILNPKLACSINRMPRPALDLDCSTVTPVDLGEDI